MRRCKPPLRRETAQYAPVFRPIAGPFTGQTQTTVCHDDPLLTYGDNWLAYYANETRAGHYGSGNTEAEAIAELIAMGE